MLILLTHSEGRRQFYMRAVDIRALERDAHNILETIVVTNLMTPSGPQAYRVIENPDEIAAMVNKSLATIH